MKRPRKTRRLGAKKIFHDAVRNFFLPKKSQWKKRKIRKVPPPINRMGADFSIDSWTVGSLENVAKREPIGPSPGLTAHIIAQGRSPLITKTAKIIPQKRNHLRALACIVESTSAFIMALSILETISNKQSPKVIIKIEKKLMRCILKIARTEFARRAERGSHGGGE